MSESYERNMAEKQEIMAEMQLLKDKAKTATELSFLKETEKDYFNKLLDSNIRVGTMACMWCMKTQVVKRVSVAFFRWKYNTVRAADGELLASRLHSTNASTLNTPRSGTASHSQALAHAISVARRIKEQNIEREIVDSPSESHGFSSPSASVKAANAAATTILQHDLQAWPTRNRSGSSLNGFDGSSSHEFKQQDEEALAAYNKQRLAYVLRSLQQQQGGNGERPGPSLTLDGQFKFPADHNDISNGALSGQSLDAYLLQSLQDPKVDVASKREILMAMSNDMLSKAPAALSLSAADAVDPDNNISARSSLSLLRGGAPKQAPGSAVTTNMRQMSRTSARSVSPNGRLNAINPNYSNNTGFFKDEWDLPQSSDQFRTPAAAQEYSRTLNIRQGGGNLSHDFARNAPTASEEAFFADHNRTYPTASSGATTSSLRSSGPSSQTRGRQAQLPRYLMPTNSYQKKVNHTSPVRGGNTGGNAGGVRGGLRAHSRSRSPTMITNSNSKHANNVFSAARGSPPAAYTIKAALNKDSRDTALASLQGPPKSNNTHPSSSHHHHNQPYRAQQQVSYGEMSFVDYQQRQRAGSGNYNITNTNSTYNRNNTPQAVPSYVNGAPLPLPLPPPHTPYNAGMHTGMSSGSEKFPGGVPLADAAMASIAEVSSAIQSDVLRSAPQIRPQRGKSVDMLIEQTLSQGGQQDMSTYDSYHYSSLRANSMDANETTEWEGGHRIHSNNDNMGHNASHNNDSMDSNSNRVKSPYTAAYYASEEEPYHPESDHGDRESGNAKDMYSIPTQHMLNEGANGRINYSSLRTPAAVGSATFSSLPPSNGSVGSAAKSSGREKRNGKKGVDKAQLALFMHGDVKEKPLNWHATLRR